MARPLAADPATTLHFIDDRLETLEAISRHPDLAARWQLYFADWGARAAFRSSLFVHTAGGSSLS